MTEFNSGRGGRDDDIVDLEAQPVNATGNSAEGSSREPIKQEPLSGTVTVAHIVYCLHSISILIGLLTAGLSIAGAFVFSAPSILAVIINYIFRSDASGTWLESHFFLANPHVLVCPALARCVVFGEPSVGIFRYRDLCFHCRDACVGYMGCLAHFVRVAPSRVAPRNAAELSVILTSFQISPGSLSMALGATVYKAQLSISDLDRNWYGEPVLTLARHPSETETRLMLRVLAWCMRAGEKLEFGRGLSTDGDPALWELDDTGAIIDWVELGVPDLRTVRKAAGKSEHVLVLAYDEARTAPWWESLKGDFSKISKLAVVLIHDDEAKALGSMATRNMKLAVTIQDGVFWVSNDHSSLQIDPEWLKREDERWT
mgnify:FL=1